MKKVLDPESVKKCGIHGVQALAKAVEVEKLEALGYLVGRSYEVCSCVFVKNRKPK